MTTLVSVSNEALAQIGAGAIATLSEPSLEARECNRFAGPLLAEISEWADWSFLRTRAVLAEVLNARPNEWGFAYAPPADMASPIAIRRVEDTPSSFALFGPGNFPEQDSPSIPFAYEGGAIFTNVPAATLVYNKSTTDLGQMAALLRRAFVLELAARICLPLKKDARLGQAIAQQAMMAREEAIADEANKNPRRTMRYTSDVEYARMGVDV